MCVTFKKMISKFRTFPMLLSNLCNLCNSMQFYAILCTEFGIPLKKNSIGPIKKIFFLSVKYSRIWPIKLNFILSGKFDRMSLLLFFFFFFFFIKKIFFFFFVLFKKF